MDTPTYRYSYPYPSPYLHPATRPRDWPSVFARVSLGDFELSAALDADLSAQALRAQTDPTARDELFLRLAAKITRFAARFDSWDITPFDADDVRQECFLVFCETLRRWQPTEPSAPAGYGAWFLRVYPLWLATSVRRWSERRARLVPLPPAHAEQPVPDADAADVDLALALVDLCACLSAADCRIVRLRVAGLAAHEVASAIGVSRRTVHRGLARVARLTHDTWREREAG